MPFKKKNIVSFIIIFGTLSFRRGFIVTRAYALSADDWCDAIVSSVLTIDVMRRRGGVAAVRQQLSCDWSVGGGNVLPYLQSNS